MNIERVTKGNEADLKNRMDAFCDELVMEKIEV